MIDAGLVNYGMAGIFISYLIYDRQILLKGITQALKDISLVMAKCKGV